MKRFKLIFEKYPFQVTMAITCLILFLRIWERFLFPSLWAEDGFVFLKDSIMLGSNSVLISYGGYYHTIPRIISLIAYHFFPVILYPYVFMISCTFFYSLTVSKLVSDDFKSLISEKWIRFSLSILLCFVPGLYEVLGNLANLHWILFFYLSLSLLSNIEKPFSLLEMLFFLFIILSTGEPIVLLPILVLKILFLLKLKLKKNLIQHSILFLFIFSVALLNFSQRLETPKETVFTNSEELKIGTYLTFNQYFIFQPTIGEKNTVKFYDKQRSIYLYSGSLISLTLMFLILKYKIYQGHILFPILLMVFFVPVLTWIVRPGSILSYINLYGIWDARYSFVLAPWGLILWVKLISSIQNLKWNFRIMLLFIFFYCSFSSYRFFLKPYGKDMDWFKEYKIADQALKTGCPKSISIPIYPIFSNSLTNETSRFNFEFTLKNDKVCP